AVKDKLKTIKVNVDTLTLTATPIPRTLQFSLMGARDLSIINTPPPNRQPVETQLHVFNEEVIRDAIHYELSRSGQAFFVHNRVQNIGEVAAMIKRLVPGARVATAHGQMDGKELEEIMMGFIEQEYDVLVATTIIESGLDISNANTIIINQAHNFGLSDLHQMRGRVGRSNKKAFCYLLAPPLSTVSNESRRRLQAIEQFSDLGSGFNIAMRDLDIRGAGNLLGGEQSGFISEIGFDMYHKILEEAVHELKEEKFADLFPEEQEEHQFVKDCQLETDLEIMIPDDYINNITERLSLYQKLAQVDNERDLERFHDELTDRFGPVPEVTSRLIETLKLRWIARDIGFEKLVLKRQRLIGYFVQNPESPYYQSPAFGRVLNFIKNNPNKATMKEKNNKLTLSFDNVRSINQALKHLRLVTGELATA
ncbi:MAG: TRCF domain-containing protein, partial [Salibacteraceae bacterium]